ncbi:type II toxin-antitoxin system RelE/ParE family toxin [Gluconobacter cerinus]|nr:type II toxin-antitoxin system RelE/ParE family toxin [Gluconobacter cerinus]MBS0984340.1 type II toxin-antitoxin system RelE/ParE family toxin [Gluconobacter cerinus]
MNRKIRVLGTDAYYSFVDSIKDQRARKAIDTRVLRFQAGNLGDCKPCGEGILEARIHVGAGYRIYMKQEGSELIILLCAGDKSSQKEDIKTAKILSKQLKK